jgi:hypothetical protein
LPRQLFSSGQNFSGLVRVTRHVNERLAVIGADIAQVVIFEPSTEGAVVALAQFAALEQRGRQRHRTRAPLRATFVDRGQRCLHPFMGVAGGFSQLTQFNFGSG